MTPRGWTGTAELDGRLAMGFVFVKRRFESVERSSSASAIEEQRQAIDVADLEMDPG